MNSGEAKEEILREARRLGFDGAGVAPGRLPDVEKERLGLWLTRGMHGTMEWMARDAAARTDPEMLLPGARSVLMARMNYFTFPRPHPGGGRISIYALGRDYHKVFRGLFRNLKTTVERVLPGVRGRWFVDSAPVLEKAYAERAGLGWRGKHTNLITEGRGSWFFLGGLLLDAELPPDGPPPDRCGSCTKCIDACPTGAIPEPYVVDGSRCISYLTIEHRGAVPRDLEDRSGDWIFGCDICQEVCPWNRDARETEVADFRPRPALTGLTLEKAAALGPGDFHRVFEGTAVRRAGFERFHRSVERALRNRPPKENESW
ncbi:MAG: tRNA epoxyqueuosine(34) reductase QueG [Candidatus Eisenbacteria bacterium]